MRTLLLVAALGLVMLSAPAPAAAHVCSPAMAVEDAVGYVHCQYGCELGAVQRLLATLDPEALIIACPA